MSSEEVLKAVFPFLEVVDLANCMSVCKQWQDVAREDYFWKCLCTKRWPSICKRQSPPAVSYYKLFQAFYKRNQEKTLLPPRLSFDDLEFYIDIWGEGTLIFSEVVAGSVFHKGSWTPPPGICNALQYHLTGPEYKMTLPVEPRFTVPMIQTVNISVLVGRKDSNKIACIINNSKVFDYIDRTAHRALAFDYLDFSPMYPFVSGVRAWISLLFLNHDDFAEDEDMDVFGIEIDFCDIANSDVEILWLLDMLDWK